MGKTKNLDLNAAHRHFSAYCFNKTWSFIDKKKRTAMDNIEMTAASFASYWHWLQRADCKAENISVSLWQLSRVFALAKDHSNALKFGKLCLSASKKKNVGPFFLAYAYEALARAEMTANNRKKMQAYLKKAEAVSRKIATKQYKGWLMNDLKSIK